MKNQLKLIMLIGALALGTLPMAACGGGGAECGEGTTEKDGECVPSKGDGSVTDEGTTCGEGTVEENGVCVPADWVVCGPKTVEDDQGRCVVSPEACEEGETLDPNSGACVAGDRDCGSGTAFDGTTNSCVPTAEVCDEGTEFDEASGLCLPGYNCGVGDVIVDGVCASPAEELASNADVTEVENNDPAMGGTAQELELNGVGAETVFTGTIGEPEDLNDDGELDQDVDVFSFEASEGDWFEISVQSLGLPSPIFTVESDNGYFRVSPAMAGSGSARQIVVPADGTYNISVLPLSYAYSSYIYGADDWGYVGSLKQIDTPSATAVNFNADTIAGEYGSLSEQYYKVEGYDAGDLVTVTVDGVGDGADGILTYWESSGAFIGGNPLSAGSSFDVVIPADGELYLLADWDFMEVTGVEFEISSERADNFQSVGTLDDDSETLSVAEDISGGTIFSYVFSMSAGQVLEISHDNATDKSMYSILKNVSGVRFLSDSITSTSAYRYFYSETGGTYILTLQNLGAEATNTVVTFRTMTPNDLGSAGVGDSISESVSDELEDGRSDFHILTLDEGVMISGDVTTPNDEDIDVYFRKSSNSALESITGSAPVEVENLLVAPGTLLIEVAAKEAVPSYDIDLELGEAPQIEVEPNDTKAEATPYDIDGTMRGTMTSSAEVDYYSFELAEDLADDEVFIIDMTMFGSGSSEFACILTDANDNDVGTINESGTTRGCLAMSDELVAGETYYLKIQRIFSSLSVEYNISARIVNGVLEAEPNDDETSANAFELDALMSGTDLYGNLPSTDTSDYFSFELAADQADDELIVLTAAEIGTNSTSGTWKVLNESLDMVANADIDEELTLGGLTAGTYYLALTRTGSSSYWYDIVYQISAAERPIVCGDGLVEGDELCDGQEHCTDSCVWEDGYMPPLINEDATSFTQGDTPFTRTIFATQCDSIAEVTVDVDFGTVNTWMDETTLVLTGPSGVSVTLHDESQGPTTRNFVGNFPNDFPVYDSNGLDGFIGENGTGMWTLNITYFYYTTAQFNSFGLNLTCD